MMKNKLETTFFLATLATFAYFVRWCIREIRSGPPKPREFTQEELQELWEQQQQEKYEKEYEWEHQDD